MQSIPKPRIMRGLLVVQKRYKIKVSVTLVLIEFCDTRDSSVFLIYGAVQKRGDINELHADKK